MTRTRDTGRDNEESQRLSPDEAAALLDSMDLDDLLDDAEGADDAEPEGEAR